MHRPTFTLRPATGLLLTLAMAGTLPAAHAAVVQSPAQNIAAPATFSGVYVNVFTGASGTSANVPSGWDINIYRSDFLYFTSPSSTAGGFVATLGVSGSDVQATSLALGAVVDASRFVPDREYAYTTFGPAPGQWRLNDTNYFGFRFLGDDGLQHYAWGTLIIGASPTVRTIGALYYESQAGVPIAVGALPVPEAPTWATLLGGGALLGTWMRRRRTAITAR